ncbi:hypothetical protein FHR94_000453 [Halomonas cerina]|uniref:Transposase n=1 Tax=Halomonas cerina TaxID=447424 RepID=A0A839V229_9GAMM|nr:hypothetical protein [Halomonas cerina]
MSRKRRQYSADFKAKVALAALNPSISSRRPSGGLPAFSALLSR